MSFTSPLFWQIHNLVASITKKNFKGSREELNQLVDLYGPDARQFLVACLVEETHFRDQRGHHQPQLVPLVRRGAHQPLLDVLDGRADAADLRRVWTYRDHF